MIDQTTLLVMPAIGLGYSVRNDPDGRLIFENDLSKIFYRKKNYTWLLEDATGEIYHYAYLKEALIQGAD